MFLTIRISICIFYICRHANDYVPTDQTLPGGLETMDETLALGGEHRIERGHHQEWLGVGGLYRRMWELQNKVLV